MEDFRLETGERKEMMNVMTKVFGSVNEEWSDREVLENYNRALATLFLVIKKIPM